MQLRAFPKSLLVSKEPGYRSLLKQHIILNNYLLYLSFIVLLFYTIVDFLYIHNEKIFYLSLSTAIAIFFIIVHFEITRNFKISRFLSTLTYFICFVFLFYWGQNMENRMLWILLFPIYAISMNGILLGSLYSVVYIIINGTIGYLGIGTWPDSSWDLFSFINFFAVLFTIILVIILYELAQVHTYKKELLKIEQLREKDQIIHRQSKQAALGELIESITHQLRQPLSNIAGINSNILLNAKMNNLDETLLEKSCDDIALTIDEMSKTIQTFRDFFNVRHTQSQFSIAQSLEIALKLFYHTFNHYGIQVVNHIDEDLHIPGIQNDFTQVLINLLSNAKDALISAQILSPTIEIKSTTLDGYLSLSISDNGKGIESSIIDQIFEPYVTTKSSNDGTGIGLHMTKQIIEKMDGTIHAMNIAEGACFTLTFKLG